ncbi:MAG: HipA domain-containing protein, partial [Firmicutes bacterium]|nr:HipA domain-containing protein [Bacillota bacterium]
MPKVISSNNLFNGKPIRAEFHQGFREWFFSVVDVVAALADPADPRKYWSVLKARLKAESSELTTNCSQLKMRSADGKLYNTDVLSGKWLIELAKRIKSPQSAAFIEWIGDFSETSKKFVLRHKDVDVIEVELDSTGVIRAFGKLYSEAHLPVGTVGRNGVDYTSIKDWWKGRAIPASRDGLRDLLDPLDIAFSQQLLDKSFGLSLSDQYWICPTNADLKWANINFFHHPFSEDVGDLLFRKLDWEGLDINAISLFSPDNTSDGVLKKKWKIINGKRCSIKGGSNSYNQEVANEVLASRICKRLGIPFVNYEIIELDGKRYSVCEDFITGDTELVTAWHIKQLVKKDNNTSDYESLIAKAEELGIQSVRRSIDMMLTLDFIIVNVDRHYNNFGFIRDANTLEWQSAAPIYDCGTSMWCRELLISAISP